MSLDAEYSSFARLIAKHERAVQAYIFASVPRWADADEIWQETSVRLWLNFDKYEPGTNFAGWAIRVAHFEILSWRKKVNRSKVVFSHELLDVLAGEQDRFSSSHSQDRLTALDQCLEHCSDDQRELLKNFYALGMSVHDISSRMKRSSEAIYKSIQRTRRSLRDCIEQRLKHGSQPS